MIFNTCLFLFVNIFFYTINAMPYQRYRRQLIPNEKDDLPYGGWGGSQSNPSGGSPGAYYGTGVNPNYGVIGPPQGVDGNIHALNYYNDFNSNSGSNSNWNVQQQYYWNNNNNNPWQTSNMGNYYDQPNNRYPPGSQGWYATGGNYWYQNKGQSLILHAGLFIISILVSIICI